MALLHLSTPVFESARTYRQWLSLSLCTVYIFLYTDVFRMFDLNRADVLIFLGFLFLQVGQRGGLALVIGVVAEVSVGVGFDIGELDACVLPPQCGRYPDLALGPL